MANDDKKAANSPRRDNAPLRKPTAQAESSQIHDSAEMRRHEKFDSTNASLEAKTLVDDTPLTYNDTSRTLADAAPPSQINTAQTLTDAAPPSQIDTANTVPDGDLSMAPPWQRSLSAELSPMRLLPNATEQQARLGAAAWAACC